VDLHVGAGSRTAVVGPSGSGKTTLLRIIAGFDLPDAGRVTLGETLLADGPNALPAHRRGIGIVTQDGSLFPHLTIAENIGFGLPRGSEGRGARIERLIDMVGLDRTMLKRKPDELSGGQQQRVALARALAREPKLMLLDEPFSALDTGLRAQTRKAVGDLLIAAGITTILVTHDQAEALSFADQVAVMRDGLLQQVGPPRELYLRPRTPMIARFLGDAIILPAVMAAGLADCALGRLAVDDPGRTGPVEIMLRREQVSIAPRPEHAAGLALAEILDVEFGGPFSTVTVRLHTREGAAVAPVGEPLILRGTGPDLLSGGDVVAIAVTGTAHVFSAPA
jgi:iron(III) transport system ATP-binding protein